MLCSLLVLGTHFHAKSSSGADLMVHTHRYSSPVVAIQHQVLDEYPLASMLQAISIIAKL
jgi:hypothetical protein